MSINSSLDASQNRKQDDIIQHFSEITDLVNAYKLSRSFMSHKKDRLYIPLISKCRLICQTFHFNIYDANSICEKYLSMWIKNTSQSHISLTTLSTEYDLVKYNILPIFFQEGKVYYETFFQFICVFVFFNYQQIISLLLSMCYVQSNFIITDEQIKKFCFLFEDTFYKNFNPEISLSDAVMSIPDLSSKAYSIKAFTNYLYTSPSFQNSLSNLKMKILKNTLSLRHYNIIVQRHYFFQHNSNVLCIEPPKEPCSEKLVRIITSSKPYPYHYDFSLVNDAPDSVDTLLFTIKQCYGYGYRGSTMVRASRLRKMTCDSSEALSSCSPKCSSVGRISLMKMRTKSKALSKSNRNSTKEVVLN